MFTINIDLVLGCLPQARSQGYFHSIALTEMPTYLSSSADENYPLHFLDVSQIKLSKVAEYMGLEIPQNTFLSSNNHLSIGNKPSVHKTAQQAYEAVKSGESDITLVPALFLPVLVSAGLVPIAIPRA